MADHIQDEEDFEALRRWWEENGKSIVATILIAVLGTVGWQQYENYSSARGEAASDLFAQMLVIREEGADTELLTGLAEELKSDYSGSTYAQFGALLEASMAVERGLLDEAEATLRWALQAADSQSDIGQLVQLRLARVLAAQGKEPAALEILTRGSEVYPVAYAQAAGDIHLAAGRESEALDAYRTGFLAARELGELSAGLDGKIRALETRQGVRKDDSISEEVAG